MKNCLSRSFIVIVLILLIIFVIFWLLFFGGDKEQKDNKSVSSDECKELIDKYDKKVIGITSPQGLEGQAGVEIEEKDDKCSVGAVYQFLFPADLEKDSILPGMPYYGYIVVPYADGEERSSWSSVGELSPAYKNKNTLPEDAFDSIPHGFYGSGSGETQTFHHYYVWSRTIADSDKVLGYITENSKLSIIDARDYYEETEIGDGQKSSQIDGQKAAIGGDIVETFDLNYKTN